MTNWDPRLVRFVRESNAAGGSYHRIVLGDDLVLDGVYDLTRFLHHYHLPEDLSGRSALDVGTATGFFAYELARRGADVTAIDLWDEVVFELLRDGLGLKGRYVQKSIYDLTPGFGRFDFVFCGSLLLHLSDLFTAVRCLHAVCAGELIVATAIDEDPRCEGEPYCRFVGRRGADGDYWTYWTPNATALEHMLRAAGFEDVEELERFWLVSEPGKGDHRVRHVVMRGRIASATP